MLGPPAEQSLPRAPHKGVRSCRVDDVGMGHGRIVRLPSGALPVSGATLGVHADLRPRDRCSTHRQLSHRLDHKIQPMRS